MKKILISIKPKYVEEIFNGSKKYEFRRRLCKEKIDKLIIYSTSPVMKVVGEAVVINKLVDVKEKVWNKTKKYSGIENKKDFDNYYANLNYACCYELGKVTKYKTPKDLKEYGIKNAPQSFVYVND